MYHAERSGPSTCGSAGGWWSADAESNFASGLLSGHTHSRPACFCGALRRAGRQAVRAGRMRNRRWENQSGRADRHRRACMSWQGLEGNNTPQQPLHTCSAAKAAMHMAIAACRHMRFRSAQARWTLCWGPPPNSCWGTSKQRQPAWALARNGVSCFAGVRRSMAEQQLLGPAPACVTLVCADTHTHLHTTSPRAVRPAPEHPGKREGCPLLAPFPSNGPQEP